MRTRERDVDGDDDAPPGGVDVEQHLDGDEWSLILPEEDFREAADGEALVCEPAKVLPLAQRYSLF